MPNSNPQESNFSLFFAAIIIFFAGYMFRWSMKETGETEEEKKLKINRLIQAERERVNREWYNSLNNSPQPCSIM